MPDHLPYLIPPFRTTNWNVVSVSSGPGRLRIVWLPPETLAVTWAIEVVSATVERNEVRVEFDDVELLGLVPDIVDGKITVNIAHDDAAAKLCVCECRDDYAVPDQDIAIRLQAEGGLVIGIACRIRPPMTAAEASRALETLCAAESTAAVPAEPPNPAQEGTHRNEIEPLLNELFAARNENDHVRAWQAVGALRPFLALAPLSLFALQAHVIEGWALMREARSADNAEAAGVAIETLRNVMDGFDERAQPSLYHDAAWYLAQAYSKRSSTGDLDRAVQAYRTVLRLTDQEHEPLAVAQLRFEIGTLLRELGEAAGGSSGARGEYATRALEELAAAGRLFDDAGQLAGSINVAIARADTARLLNLPGAADLYADAFQLLTAGPAQQALGAADWKTFLNHVYRSMRHLDSTDFGIAQPEIAVEQERAAGMLLRPLSATRRITIVTPAQETPLSLEAGLARALAPVVPLVYVGGGIHTAGGSLWAAVGEERNAEWQDFVAWLLPSKEVVFFVPGESEGLQWELFHLIDHGMMRKTVFVMPPEPAQAAAFSPRDAWEHTRNAAGTRGLRLPPYEPEGAFVRIGDLQHDATMLEFEAIWTSGVLLQWIDDLLLPPGEVARRAEEARPRLEQLEREGRITRIKL